MPPIPHTYPPSLDLEQMVDRHFALSTSLPTAFFAQEAERIAQACWAMARRFYRGGRILAFGDGSCATDAQHISVEFIHPVIVGKRALPAIALTNDGALLTAFGTTGSHDSIFARQLEILGNRVDIAVGILPLSGPGAVTRGLRQAHDMGMLTIGLAGAGDDPDPAAHDFWFSVPTDNPFLVQEVHETLYHVLWELVHVFFEHEGLLVERDT